MENTMDPSHVNWLHDGTAGKWEDAYPMKMQLLDNAIDAHKVQLSCQDVCLFSCKPEQVYVF